MNPAVFNHIDALLKGNKIQFQYYRKLIDIGEKIRPLLPYLDRDVRKVIEYRYQQEDIIFLKDFLKHGTIPTNRGRVKPL